MSTSHKNVLHAFTHSFINDLFCRHERTSEHKHDRPGTAYALTHYIQYMLYILLRYTTIIITCFLSKTNLASKKPNQLIRGQCQWMAFRQANSGVWLLIGMQQIWTASLSQHSMAQNQLAGENPKSGHLTRYAR